MARIEITGVLGKDPEIKFIKGKNGDFAVTEFSVADSQSENKNGEWVDGVTVWYKVSVLGRKAEMIVDSISKGQRVKVSGAFKVTEYTAKDGSQKQGLEIKADDITLPISASKPKPKAAQEDTGWDSSWN